MPAGGLWLLDPHPPLPGSGSRQRGPAPPVPTLALIEGNRRGVIIKASGNGFPLLRFCAFTRWDGLTFTMTDEFVQDLRRWVETGRIGADPNGREPT